MMQQRVGAELRRRIALFGRTNVGKSTLMNRLVGQPVSIVSHLAGTTTDSVRRSLEFRDVGACTLIDTPGLDDGTPLGEQRERAALEIIPQIDLALLLVADNTWGEAETQLSEELRRQEVPCLIVYAKSDVTPPSRAFLDSLSSPHVAVSAEKGTGVEELIARVGEVLRRAEEPPQLFEGLIESGDTVMLIIPLDSAAPKGRLILPQVLAIRAALDLHAMPILCREEEIEQTLGRLRESPALVVTDSQIYAKADAIVPEPIPLTSFSMLLARQKGDFPIYLRGAKQIANLCEGDRVLIIEGCTHHATCDDIGRVKIPRWLERFVGASLQFDFVSGQTPLPKDLTVYSLALICGGCMNTPRQMRGRIRPLVECGVFVTNYGMAIAYVQGIFARAVRCFTASPVARG